jgi:hypothetical protein
VIDEFSKNFAQVIFSHGISACNSAKRTNRKSNLSDSEVMTIWCTFILVDLRILGLSICSITKIKKNMKNALMLMQDKIALRKRALIETVDDELKNRCQIENIGH